MRRLLTPLLALTLLALAAPAEARFGKRHEDDDSDGSSSSSSSPSASNEVHEASSPNSPGGGRRGGYVTRDGGGYRGRPWYGGYGPRYRRYGFGFWYAPAPVLLVDGSSAPEPEPQSPGITATLGADAQLYREGGAGLGLSLDAEGERFGVALQFTGMLLPTDDGTAGVDTIKLFNGELTYAFLSAPGARLRLEGGLHSAFAPDLIVVGPGVGLSGAAQIVGPLGIEGALRLTPFPFRQLDATAALTLGFGIVGVRGGYRYTVLDDAGLVDGIRNVESFSGPFVGLALLL